MLPGVCGSPPLSDDHAQGCLVVLRLGLGFFDPRAGFELSSVVFAFNDDAATIRESDAPNITAVFRSA